MVNFGPSDHDKECTVSTEFQYQVVSTNQDGQCGCTSYNVQHFMILLTKHSIISGETQRIHTSGSGGTAALSNKPITVIGSILTSTKFEQHHYIEDTVVPLVFLQVSPMGNKGVAFVWSLGA